MFANNNNNNNNNTGIVDPMSSLTSSTLNTSWLQIDDERSIAEMKHFRKGMPNTDMYALLQPLRRAMPYSEHGAHT